MPVDGYIFRRAYVNFKDLASNPAPRLLVANLSDFGRWIVENDEGNTDYTKLKKLLNCVSLKRSYKHKKRYI
jgi:hypothetical protein